MAFLHASYSGYFPFCVDESGSYEVGDGTPWPIGISLDECMFLYWRAKSFNLVENWSTSSDIETTVNGSTNITMNATGDKMSDAICTTYQSISALSGTFAIYFTSAGGDPGPYYFQDSLLLYLFFGGSQVPQVIKSGSLYYPQIYFQRVGGYQEYQTWSSWTGNFAFPTFAYTASIKLGDPTADPYQFSIFSENTLTTYTNTYSDFTVTDERSAD
jgi:hypothetical protein